MKIYLSAGILLVLVGLVLFLKFFKEPPTPYPVIVWLKGGECTLGSKGINAWTSPFRIKVDGFGIGKTEVTVAQFLEFLNEVKIDYEKTHQIAHQQDGYIAKDNCEKKPVSCVTHNLAKSYCSWLGNKWGCTVRLPDDREWEYAARGGIRRAPFPWGWGEAKHRAAYNLKEAATSASYPPNEFGLYDMAGNVWEWCNNTNENIYARGGSWSERSAEMLKVYRRCEFTKDYSDKDVGFRVLLESPPVSL